MLVITATELKHNTGRYLKLVKGEDVVITRNGKFIAKLTKVDTDTMSAARTQCAADKKEASEAAMTYSTVPDEGYKLFYDRVMEEYPYSKRKKMSNLIKRNCLTSPYDTGDMPNRYAYLSAQESKK